jgi:hypothetical protein
VFLLCQTLIHHKIVFHKNIMDPDLERDGLTCVGGSSPIDNKENRDQERTNLMTSALSMRKFSQSRVPKQRTPQNWIVVWSLIIPGPSLPNLILILF